MKKKYTLTSICAVSLDGVIGINDTIPWGIPEDFKHFRKTTINHKLIIGKTTYFTLPDKAFESREYYVLNGGKNIDNPRNNVKQFESMENLFADLENCNGEIFVAGGESIYNLLLPFCNKAIVTYVSKFYPDGNRFFPVDSLYTDFDNELEIRPWTKSSSGYLYKIIEYRKCL